MCNAHNHPPGCTCGWGGGWHSNSYGGYWGHAPALTSWVNHPSLVSRQVPPAKQDSNKETRISAANLKPGELRSGWVNPNATCPVCGCAVYFYQSEDGARVFFDELGPPWPKHSCTIHKNTKPAPNGSTRLASQSTRWDQDGWFSLENPRVFRIGEGTLRRVRGTCGDIERSFLFRIKADVTLNVVRFKESKKGIFELSFLARMEKTKSWCIGTGQVSEGNLPLISNTIDLRIINDATLNEATHFIQKIHEVNSEAVTGAPSIPVKEPIPISAAVLSRSLLQELDAIDQELLNLRSKIRNFRSNLIITMNNKSQ